MFKHPQRLRERFGPSKFKFHYLEHHQTHAASAFFVSPFDTAAILTWDGTGEETTTLFARGKGNKIEVLKRIKLPHSLGQFYSAVTNYIGFDMFAGDEWKVMGLAAYGKPKFYDFFRERVLTTNGSGDFRSSEPFTEWARCAPSNSSAHAKQRTPRQMKPAKSRHIVISTA